MTVGLRGTSGWTTSTSAAPSWPTGTAKNDVAFLLALTAVSPAYEGSVVSWTNRPSAWVPLYSSPFEDTGKLSVYRLTVPTSTTGLLVSPAISSADPNATMRQYLVVFKDTAGIDTKVTGTARVSVAPYGAGFITGVDLAPSSNLDSLASYDTALTALASSSGGTIRSFWRANNTGSYTNVGSTSVTGMVVAVELLPAAGPDKPTILTPVAGAQVSTTDDVELTWQHNPGVDGGSQDAFVVWVRQDGGTWYSWDASAGTLTSTTGVINASTTEGMTLPVSVLSGDSVEFDVTTREAIDGQWSPESDSRTFPRVAPPTVVVTGPGALSGDLSPTITWVTTPASGLAQIDYRVVVTGTGDAVRCDSGTLSGSAQTITIPAGDTSGETRWVSGESLTATVTVTQTGGAQASDTDTFSVSWTAPTAPTVTATAATQGVTVVVTAEADRLVRVWRRDGSADTLLGSWETGADDTLTLVDAFGPRSAVTYVAQVWSDLEGVVLPSTQAVSASVTRTDGNCFYLASGRDPVQTWQAVEIREEGDRTHVRPVSAVWPIGTTFSRTLSGESRGRVGAFTAHATTGVDLDDLVDLLESGEVLLCWFPPEPHSDGTSSGYVLPMAVTSEVGESRLAQVPYALRILSWSWAERSTPTVGVSVAPVTNPVVLS